jgi:addiction module HigA family antidote
MTAAAAGETATAAGIREGQPSHIAETRFRADFVVDSLRREVSHNEVVGSGSLPAVHPGGVLRDEYLKPLGMTPYRLAKGLRVSQTRIGDILDGKRAITADTAMRLEAFFGTSARFWMNLQVQYDLEMAARSADPDIAQITSYSGTAATTEP